MKAKLALLYVLFWAGLRTLHAGGDGSDPKLRVETGMHTGIIWAIDGSAARHLVATAGFDGTARVWDAQTGRLFRTLLMPFTEALNSIALSPDGRRVACGGWTHGGSIYIFDLDDGHLEKHLSGLADTSAHLTYNRDGTLLAVTIYGHGVRVYRTSDYSVVFETLKNRTRPAWVRISTRRTG